MAEVSIGLVFNIRSELGQQLISQNSISEVLQIPIVEIDDFVRRVAVCRPSVETIEVADTSEAGMRRAALEVLPNAPDWSLGDTVVMNSCKYGREWKPCDRDKPRFGFAVLYQGVPLLRRPIMVERDARNSPVSILQMDVVLMLQVL